MKPTKTAIAAAAAATFVPYSKKQMLKPETLKLFLAYAEDTPNWSGRPLVNGNVGKGLGDVGRLSHMKMAGLVTTEKTSDRVNGKIAHLSWVCFTPAGVALAAEHGITISVSGTLDDAKARLTQLQAKAAATTLPSLVEDAVVEPTNCVDDEIKATGWEEVGGIGLYTNPQYPAIWIDTNSSNIWVHPIREEKGPFNNSSDDFWSIFENFTEFDVWLKTKYSEEVKKSVELQAWVKQDQAARAQNAADLEREQQVVAKSSKTPRKSRAKKVVVLDDVKAVATMIVNKYYNDLAFMEAVDESSDTYRTMYMHCGSLANGIVDGSDEYAALISEMEAQMTAAATISDPADDGAV